MNTLFYHNLSIHYHFDIYIKERTDHHQNIVWFFFFCFAIVII